MAIAPVGCVVADPSRVLVLCSLSVVALNRPWFPERREMATNVQLKEQVSKRHWIFVIISRRGGFNPSQRHPVSQPARHLFFGLHMHGSWSLSLPFSLSGSLLHARCCRYDYLRTVVQGMTRRDQHVLHGRSTQARKVGSGMTCLGVPLWR